VWVSQSLINLAQDYIKKHKISNVEFICTDLLHFNIDEQFDMFYIRGSLMCISDSDIIPLLLKKSFIKQNGYFISLDSISMKKTYSSEQIESINDFRIYRSLADYLKFLAVFSKLLYIRNLSCHHSHEFV
jgi:hypothetical protein